MIYTGTVYIFVKLYCKIQFLSKCVRMTKLRRGDKAIYAAPELSSSEGQFHVRLKVTSIKNLLSLISVGKSMQVKWSPFA